jgi:hypothetical protein
MKNAFLSAMLLLYCTFQSMAQFQANAVTAGTITGLPTTVGTTLIYGTGSTDAGQNVLIGNGVTVTSSAACSSNVIIGDGAGGTGGVNNAAENVIIGQGAGAAVTTGWANVFIGRYNAPINTTGTANAFLGQYCGIANTTGSENCFMGQASGTANTEGNYNTFVGRQSALGNTTGDLNTHLGWTSGSTNTTGNANTIIGAGADATSGTFNYATAIGAYATVGASNSMVLGGAAGTANVVNVGIGVNVPISHLQTNNDANEKITFQTTNTGTASNTTVELLAPTNNRAQFVMNGSGNTGTLLTAITSLAPAVGKADLTELVTDGSALAIGMTAREHYGSIHFINYVATNSPPTTYNLEECMRINKLTGFVGIRTRSSSQTSGTGEPQALFHVNLHNIINPSFDPLTQGVRFEGLLAASSGSHAYPDVLVVDASGNVATVPIGSASNDWHLTGNTTVTPFNEWIGTINNDDFRIKTNSVLRGRVTLDGNFDFGGNTFSSSATSAAIGTTNQINTSVSAIAAGSTNTIYVGDYSAAFGDANSISNSAGAITAGTSNTITNSSNYSATFGNGNSIEGAQSSQATGSLNEIHPSSSDVFIAGNGHKIYSSSSVMALGGGDIINFSQECVAAGEDDSIDNGHGCFMGGGHNHSDGWYNTVAGSHNRVFTHDNFIGGGYNYSNVNFSALLGNYLRSEATASAMPTPFTSPSSTIVIGEQINSDLPGSASIGFLANRTSVTTARGMAVQLNPGTLNTYIPTVNFEVDAALAPSPGPLPMGAARSNVRFHNLPASPAPPLTYPTVVIDPATGELFQSTVTFGKPGNSSSSADVDSLKARVSQLESLLTTYNDKFAALAESINQICEKGCAGLNTNITDELYQSVPNPAGKDVIISYYLSRNYTQADITVISLEGKVLRKLSVNPNKGNGSVGISLGELPSGVYLYQLVVDGKEVGAKRMQKQ